MEAPKTVRTARPKAIGRILDVLAVIVVAFAVWKIFIAPRFFASSAKAVAAPAIVVPMLGGGDFELAKQRGHVVFLDFWATWCEPCKLSIPLIERYKAANPHAIVISIDAGEPPALVTQFAQARKMQRVAFDPEMDVAHAFGVQVFPTMIVIDAQGKERAKWIGFNPLIEGAMRNAAATFGSGS